MGAGRRIEIVADTANYRGRPKLDRVIFAPADATAAATQVLTGQADFMEAFPVDQCARAGRHSARALARSRRASATCFSR